MDTHSPHTPPRVSLIFLSLANCWWPATTGSQANDDDDDDDPGGHKTRKRAILGMVCTHSVLPEKAKTVSFCSSVGPPFEQHSTDTPFLLLVLLLGKMH